mmetsp:Transcript_16658/g.42177  ORF Transcript_16658/g.42177 Transcript_16658/m.42177 type:complete len:478 (+) Transcript_16658:194-1627(+)
MTLRTHGPEVFTRSVARPSRIATCAVLAVLLLSAKTASVDGAVQHGAKHPESYIGETYSGFIKRFGDKLVDQNCREYFANGWNSWGLLEAAAGQEFALPDNWTEGGREFVKANMETAKKTQFNTLRVFAHAISEEFPVQMSDGVYNEDALKAMDLIINEASKYGLRLIIPLANNWLTVDSKSNFANWTADALGMPRPENPDDIFFTNPLAREKYKQHISTLLYRVNSENGIKWRDDPAILAWNIMNEPRCDVAMRETCERDLHNWLHDMAGHIKSIDSNHLVGIGSEGFYAVPDDFRGSNVGVNPGLRPGDSLAEAPTWSESTGQDFIKNTAIPDIDFATLHLWIDDWGVEEETMPFIADWLLAHMQDAKALGKPLIMQEFGKKLNETANEADETRVPYFNAIYRIANRSARKGGVLKGSLFWEWQYEDWGKSTSEYSRPYGVVEGGATWNSTVMPFSATLADFAKKHLLAKQVPGC